MQTITHSYIICTTTITLLRSSSLAQTPPPSDTEPAIESSPGEAEPSAPPANPFEADGANASPAANAGVDAEAPAEDDAHDGTDGTDDTREERFRQLVVEALREYEGGFWREARALFRRAHELLPSAEALRMMANASFELGEYARALTLYERALAETRRPLRPARAEEARAAMERARLFVGIVDFELHPPGAQLEIDLARIERGEDGTVRLDPGAHRVVARAAGYVQQRHTIEVRAGERQRFVISLTPFSLQEDPPPVSPEPETPSEDERAPESADAEVPSSEAEPLDLRPLLSARREAREARMRLRMSRASLIASALALVTGSVLLGISSETDSLAPTFTGDECRYDCRWSGGRTLGLTLTLLGGVAGTGGLIGLLVRRLRADRAEARVRGLERSLAEHGSVR